MDENQITDRREGGSREPAITTQPPSEPTDDPQGRLDQDYQWGRTDPEVLRLYSGQVVAVYRREVLGAGRDHLAALRAARRRPNCPARENLTFLVVPYATADRDPELAPRFRDREVQEQYGGLVAAVHEGTILGAGNDREGAWRAAQRRPDCPSPNQVRYVLIPAVGLTSLSP